MFGARSRTAVFHSKRQASVFGHTAPSHRSLQRFLEIELAAGQVKVPALRDRKSTRLNSSHLGISYAVFCHTPYSTLFSYTTLFRSIRPYSSIASLLAAIP